MALKDKWIEKVDRVDIASAGDINLVAQAVIELEENGGTKDELDLKANAADVYTKTESDRLLSAKADNNSVYTKTESDEKLDLKANAADVYTKSETDAKVSAVTYWGGNVSSVSQLPSSPKAGTYCYVMADISNGVKYTGRVGDLFSCDGGDLWSYTLMFTPPSKCVYTEPDVTVNPSYTFIYNESGTRLGSISIDPTEMPGAFDASLLGVTSADDMVTFYLGIHNNGTFPAHIYNFKAGEMIFWNGSMWCAVPPSSVVDKIKAALSAIKQKSIPHTSVSEYPVSISDHLENEEVINYRIYGNSVQSETPSVDNPVEVQSVGDLVTDAKSEYYGKYDVPVTVCGKNLFDMETVLPKHGFVKQDDGSYYVASNGTLRGHVLWENTENYTGKLKILCQYKYLKSSSDSAKGAYMFVRYTDGTYMSVYFTSSWEADTWYYPASAYTITASGKTIKDIAWSYATGANSTWVKDIIITKDTTVTEYEPYVGETKHFYLSEPLRKVGDYADYIDFENQKIEPIINEKTLNGTENWVLGTSLTDTISFNCSQEDAVYNNAEYSVLSNRFVGRVSGISSNDSEFVQMSGTKIHIRINKSRLSEESIDAFKTWLSTNNVKIIYPIATPTEESITVPELTALNSEVMNVFSSTATPPSNINFIYYQDINKVITELKNAILSQGGDV